YGLAQNVGMASRFLLAGVDAYLGALWPIHAESAASFASEFLHHLCKGTGLGEAVRQARCTARAEEQGGELAWASYVVYGDPLLRLGDAQAGERM
ncbi:MAG: CHAT domain-containing protein, partial [Candidatus Hydrogenedentes bacterium]|nr:CHAT domain-containing protein [Candidatus Hydrogenedentota bacterium]